MDMEQNELEHLLERYRAGEASIAERALLENWITAFSLDETGLSADELAKDLELVAGALPLPEKKVRLWPRLAAAAVATVVLGIGLYFYTLKRGAADLEHAPTAIVPGGNRAFLTLAGGKKIAVGELPSGEVAMEGGIRITKSDSGELVYTASGGSASGPDNTFETPKGGTFQLRLPDGTRVWMNAQSSLRYPSSFASLAQRRVELSGEAYFEVAKDPAHPFIVAAQGQQVKVLGTHFNVSAYPGRRAVRTTLLEGKVEVALVNGSGTGTGPMVLSPDEQAVLQSGKLSRERVDASDAVAWKDGLFLFQDEPLEEIMDKISRWYDVEVEFRPGADRYRTFGGGVSRYDKVSVVLDMLQSTGRVKFRIEGRRILVMD